MDIRICCFNKLIWKSDPNVPPPPSHLPSPLLSFACKFQTLHAWTDAKNASIVNISAPMSPISIFLWSIIIILHHRKSHRTGRLEKTEKMKTCSYSERTLKQIHLKRFNIFVFLEKMALKYFKTQFEQIVLDFMRWYYMIWDDKAKALSIKTQSFCHIS